MRGMKGITALLLALIWLLGCSAACAAEDMQSGDFSYCFLDEENVSITGYSGNAQSLTIPGEIDGHPVKMIDWQAFKNCDTLTDVYICEGIEVIGEDAFCACIRLQSIELPSSLRVIGNDAFAVCKNLEAIELPNGLESIGNQAFQGCDELKTLVIPEGVVSIGDEALKECQTLRAVSIPDSAVSVGSDLLLKCPALTEIVLSDEQPALSLRDGVLFDKDGSTLILYPPNQPILSELTYAVPEGTERIAHYAFAYNDNLNSMTIPDSVTEIGDHAFFCTGLHEVTIPGSVKQIGEYLFLRSKTLQHVVFEEGAQSIGEWAFMDCYALETVTIPASVTEMADRLFEKDVMDTMTMIVESGSVAEQYAQAHGIATQAQ